MEWILYICTSGWVMCGLVVEARYPSEAACYRAMDELYKRNPPNTFKYVLCKLATPTNDASGEGEA